MATNGGGKPGWNLALEAIPAGTEIAVEIIVNLDQLAPERGYGPSQEAAELIKDPNSLAEAVFNHGKIRWAREAAFYRRAGLPKIAERLENQSLLPIGFGVGWNAMTIGPLLKPGEISQARISFHRGHPPPISRRLALDRQGEPVAPLGWMKPRWERWE